MGRVFSIIVFTLIGVGGGFFAGKWYVESAPVESENNDANPEITSVLAEGKIKPANGFRFVTTLPGRKVEKLNVSVGSKVSAQSTELCVMADEPVLKMQWDMAKAKTDDLASEVDQKILAAELNKSSAEAALKEAKLSQMRLASDSPESSYVDKKIESSIRKLNRLKELANEDATAAFVSTQDIFDQELELEKAKSEKVNLKKAADLAVETAQKALEIADKALQNAKSAKTESKSLALAIAIAEKQYEDSKIYAPIDGEVTQIHTEAGDNVTNLPLMEIADLSSMIVEAEVYFASLPKIKVGQRATISSPALEKTLSGKVVSKSNYIGNSLLQSANPLAMTNQETAKVKIEIDSEFTEIARSFLNLQVTVEIDTK